MKRPIITLSGRAIPILLWIGLLLGGAVANPLWGQAPASEAEAAEGTVTPSPARKAIERTTKSAVRPMNRLGSIGTAPLMENLRRPQPSPASLEQRLQAHMQPAQPLRPIPWVLTLVGLAFMAVWAGLLIGAILTGGTTLGVVLLVLTIVFSVVLVLGLLLFIGGLIAGFSGGKKRRPPVPTPDDPKK